MDPLRRGGGHQAWNGAIVKSCPETSLPSAFDDRVKLQRAQRAWAGHRDVLTAGSGDSEPAPVMFVPQRTKPTRLTNAAWNEITRAHSTNAATPRRCVHPLEPVTVLTHPRKSKVWETHKEAASLPYCIEDASVVEGAMQTLSKLGITELCQVICQLKALLDDGSGNDATGGADGEFQTLVSEALAMLQQLPTEEADRVLETVLSSSSPVAKGLKLLLGAGCDRGSETETEENEKQDTEQQSISRPRRPSNVSPLLFAAPHSPPSAGLRKGVHVCPVVEEQLYLQQDQHSHVATAQEDRAIRQHSAPLEPIVSREPSPMDVPADDSICVKGFVALLGNNHLIPQVTSVSKTCHFRGTRKR